MTRHDAEISESELPKDFVKRVYKLEGFKDMDTSMRYGLKEISDPEQLRSAIKELAKVDYSTQLRHSQSMAAMRKSQLKEEDLMRKSFEAELQRQALLEAEKEKAEQVAAAKAEEERMKKLKTRVDEYQITLMVREIKAGAQPPPEDLSVEVERVFDKIRLESHNFIYVPWNKLTTRVGLPSPEPSRTYVQLHYWQGEDGRKAAYQRHEAH